MIKALILAETQKGRLDIMVNRPSFVFVCGLCRLAYTFFARYGMRLTSRTRGVHSMR